MKYKRLLVLLFIIMVMLSIFGCKKKSIGTSSQAGDSLNQDHSMDPFIPSNVDIDTLVYEDKEGEVLLNIAKVDQIILPERYKEENPALSDVIDQYNVEKDAEAKKFIDEQKYEIRTMRSERNDDTLMLSYENIVSVNRIDDIFSFIDEVQCYLGGAHGSYAIIGRNYIASNGKELTSSEVFTNKNRLKDILIEKIKDEYGEEQMFPEWIDTLDSHFKEDKPLNILVGNEFVDVMFEPYYLGPWSTGNITITLPYKEYSGILNKKYFR